MSFSKQFSWLFVAAALVLALPGCREEPDPGNLDPWTGRNGDLPQTGPEYKFVSYDVLLSTLEDTLGVQESFYPGGVAVDGTEDPASPDNPREDPVGFFKARGVTMGQPIFNPDSPNSTISTGFSSLGMKNWVHTAAGACGKAVVGPKAAELFPAAGNYDAIFLTLLGRYPTSQELSDINEHVAQFSTVEQKQAAVCTALLGTMEFLTIN